MYIDWNEIPQFQGKNLPSWEFQQEKEFTIILQFFLIITNTGTS